MKVTFKKMIYAYLYYNFISQNIKTRKCKDENAYKIV